MSGLGDFEQALVESGLHPVPEHLREKAYQTFSTQRRGVIKLTLALIESVHGQHAHTLQAALRPEFGLGHSLRREPADWTLCLLGADYASAPRLAAVLMLARLVGQEHILVVRACPDAHFPAELLTTLELLGLDAVYTCGENGISDLLPAILHDAFGPSGRVLCFGVEIIDAMSGYPVWKDQPPRLALASSNPDAEAVLRWAHPDGIWSLPHDPTLTALYCADIPGGGMLRFGPGLEGCWLPVDLEPEFFMVRRRAVHICEDLSLL